MTTYDHGGDIFAIARQQGRVPDDFLDFSASINPLGMPVGVREAIVGQIDRLVHYPDADAEPLREALALHHGVASGQICPANGTTELIYLLPRLAAGNRALIVAPAFSEYAKALEATGWRVEYQCLSPADGFALSLESLETRLGKGYDILYLCNPGNPTGRLYTRAEIEVVGTLCRESGTLLVLDEAFIDFCGEEASSARQMACNGNGIVLRSLTKFYAIPGLRLGYAVADEKLCDRLSRLRGPWSVNTLAQQAGIAALADSGFREKSLAFVRREREELINRFSAISCLQPFPSTANYVLLRLGNGHLAGDIRRKLLARHILIRDCSSFVGLDESFIRVAVRTREENARLVDNLAESLA